MRRLAGFIVLLGCVILGAIGCPSKSSSPSSPSAPTNTPVPSGTPTGTATKTATGTVTNTQTMTATSTRTGTPTLSPTPTLTGSPTNSATQTATSTITQTTTVTATSTITNTPTVTATSTPSATPTPGCIFTLNDGSNLTVNGNWTSQTNSTISLSGLHGTTSSNSVDVDITTGAGYNPAAKYSGYYPGLINATAIVMDITVDASVTTGSGTYCQLFLQADTVGASNQYQVNATTASPSLVGGAQSVTFTLAYGASNLTAANTITGLYLNLNEQLGTTGNIYIGDIKVIYPSTCPTGLPTPVAADSFTFEGNSLTNALGTWVTTGTNVNTGIGVVNQGQDSSYSMAVTGAFTASGQQVQATIYPGTPIDGSTFNGVEAWVYLPSTTLVGGFPGVFLQLSDGTNYPETPYINLTHAGWTYVNFPASSWGGSFNASNITMVQVIAQSDSNGSYGTGYILVDNVDFY